MRAIHTLFIVVLLIPALFSCKKDAAHNTAACQIVATHDTIWSAQGIQISSSHIVYDNDGRIAYQLLQYPHDTTTRVFSYRDSMIIVTPTTDRMSIDTVWLNAKKQPAMLNVTFPGISTYTATYTYDASGQLQSSLGWNHPSNKIATTYAFENGDCTSTTSDGNVSKYTFFTDKPYRTGDGLSFGDYFNYGVVITKNAHLVKSAQYGQSLWLFNYTFDNEGKITSTTQRFGSQVNKSSFEYDCSQ